MRADRPYVANLHDQYRAGDTSVELIMNSVFTTDEADEMRVRLEMQDSLGPVLDYVDGHPETFAGLYLDNEASGDLVVAFTGDVDHHRNELSYRFDFPNRLRVVEAEVADEVLNAVVAEITDEQPVLLEEHGIAVSGVGRFPRSNTVQVLVQADEVRAQRYFDERYPDVPVSVDRGGMESTAAVPGGTGWTNTTRGVSYTVGFSYRNSTGGRGFLTAGHCAFGGDNMQISPYPSQNYTMYGWAEAGSTDSAPTFSVPAGDTTNVAGWALIASTGGLHDDQVGMYICWYGHTTGTERCGTVASKTFTSTLVPPNCSMHGCTSVANTRLVDMGCGNAAVGGDSGGPAYTSAGVAFGLIRGSASTAGCPSRYTVYSHLQYALSHWGLIVPM